MVAAGTVFPFLPSVFTQSFLCYWLGCYEFSLYVMNSVSSSAALLMKMIFQSLYNIPKVFGLAVNLITSLCLPKSLPWIPHCQFHLYWVPIVPLCTALSVMNLCPSMNNVLKTVIVTITYLGHFTLVSRSNLCVSPFTSWYTSYYYTMVTCLPDRILHFNS